MTSCLHCKIMWAIGTHYPVKDGVAQVEMRPALDALAGAIADLLSPLDPALRSQAMLDLGKDIARKLAIRDADPVKRLTVAPSDPIGGLHGTVH